MQQLTSGHGEGPTERVTCDLPDQAERLENPLCKPWLHVCPEFVELDIRFEDH